MKELTLIQTSLKAPKSQRNNFGNYNYRSCEDILEAVKPLLAQHDCTLTISDDIILVGERFYIKATATVKNSTGESESTTAFAREAESKKGMDESQITGSASSYARKYALNGLFAIDDTKDADATNTHGKTATAVPTSLDSDWRKAYDACRDIKELYALAGQRKAQGQFDEEQRVYCQQLATSKKWN